MSDASSITSEANPADDDALRPEYDAASLAGGTFGKFHADFVRSHPFRLDPDVAEHFHDEASINAALRMVIDLGRIVGAPKRPAEAKSPTKQSA